MKAPLPVFAQELFGKVKVLQNKINLWHNSNYRTIEQTNDIIREAKNCPVIPENLEILEEQSVKIADFVQQVALYFHNEELKIDMLYRL